MYSELFLNKGTPLLAVDIGLKTITVAQLSLNRNQYELMNIGVVQLPEGSIVDGLVEKPKEVVDSLKQLIKTEKFKSRYVVASIPGDHGVVRRLKLPANGKASQTEEIVNEIEQEIPFDIDDVRYDYQIIEAPQNGAGNYKINWETVEENNIEIIVTAVQNEIIDNRFDTIIEAGLTPVIFDLDIFAATKALSLTNNLSRLGPCALFHLSDPYTHINIMNSGYTAFDRSTPIFGHCSSNWKVNMPREPFKKNNKIEEYFTKKFYKGDAAEGRVALEKKLIAIEPDKDSVEKMLDEADETFDVFSQSTNEKVKRIFICGGGALIYGMQNLISDHFKTPVEIINPFSAIKVNSKHYYLDTLNDLSPQFAVVLGLAARRFDYK